MDGGRDTPFPVFGRHWGEISFICPIRTGRRWHFRPRGPLTHGAHTWKWRWAGGPWVVGCLIGQTLCGNRSLSLAQVGVCRRSNKGTSYGGNLGRTISPSLFRAPFSPHRSRCLFSGNPLKDLPQTLQPPNLFRRDFRRARQMVLQRGKNFDTLNRINAQIGV